MTDTLTCDGGSFGPLTTLRLFRARNTSHSVVDAAIDELPRLSPSDVAVIFASQRSRLEIGASAVGVLRLLQQLPAHVTSGAINVVEAVIGAGYYSWRSTLDVEHDTAIRALLELAIGQLNNTVVDTDKADLLTAMLKLVVDADRCDDQRATSWANKELLIDAARDLDGFTATNEWIVCDGQRDPLDRVVKRVGYLRIDDAAPERLVVEYAREEIEAATNEDDARDDVKRRANSWNDRWAVRVPHSLRHRACPTELIEEYLEKVQGRAGYKIRLDKIASCPNAPIWVLEKCSTSGNYDTRCSIARNPRTPAGTLLAMAAAAKQQQRVLDRLAGSSNVKVRIAVANHPKTLDETLDRLARSGGASARAAMRNRKIADTYGFGTFGYDAWCAAIDAGYSGKPENLAKKLMRRLQAA